MEVKQNLDQTVVKEDVVVGMCGVNCPVGPQSSFTGEKKMTLTG